MWAGDQSRLAEVGSTPMLFPIWRSVVSYVGFSIRSPGLIAAESAGTAGMAPEPHCTKTETGWVRAASSMGDREVGEGGFAAVGGKKLMTHGNGVTRKGWKSRWLGYVVTYRLLGPSALGVAGMARLARPLAVHAQR